MKINKKKIYENKEKYVISGSLLILVIVISIFTMWILRVTMEGNIIRRVTNESEFLAKQQAELISKQIDEQFNKVSTISGMIENGLSFYEGGNQKILSSFVEKNKLCTLAYADRKGEVLNYQGENIGNISGQTYFEDIISGRKEFVCQYLNKDGLSDEPRIVFFAPVYQNGEINGVVFFSKKIEILSGSLFQQSMFQDQERSIIVNTTGNILVKNRRAKEKHPDAENINDIYTASHQVMKKFKSVQSGSLLWDDNQEILAYSSIGINDWYLVCLIDTDVARREYASNLIAIRRSIIFLNVIFIVGIIYFFIIMLFHNRNRRNAYKESQMQYERIQDLLQKMKCMIMKYDTRTGKITTNASFEKTFGEGFQDDFFEKMKENKTFHPEFNVNGMMRELNYATDYKVTRSFDSIYRVDKTTYKMFSMVMMPVINEKGQVTTVLGSIRETNDEHQQLKTMLDMFNQIPGGTYRCELVGPPHFEYVGERLCKMLGYTEQEFYESVGEHYIDVIAREDQKKYMDFITDSTASPGVRGCQYRVLCKNGEMLSVLDTMESIKNDFGIVYGYSVVIDISEYAKRQNIIRQEVKQMEANLEMLRIRNSTSQMQPHFLYNALASIRELILMDTQYASDMLCDFTIYLRACIRTMQDGDPVSIFQELDSIKAYVNIEKMRMGDKLNIVYDLRSEDFKIVPLSIQPLVENAIRHGVYHRGREGGTVTIKTETLSRHNLIIVKDDGIGFDYQKVRDEVERGERDSIGLDNVIYRLKKQLQAEVVIKSKIGEGTIIAIRVPRKEKK